MRLAALSGRVCEADAVIPAFQHAFDRSIIQRFVKGARESQVVGYILVGGKKR